MLREGLRRLASRCSGGPLVREVEEELQFHIEMRAQDYERAGLTSNESRAKARERFGDYADIKSQCVEIGVRNSVGTWIQKGLFAIAFCLGIFIRSLNIEFHVTRIGDVLIMISIFGWLLLAVTRMSFVRSESTPVRLELSDRETFIPTAFDADGRTPFERVREGEQ